MGSIDEDGNPRPVGGLDWGSIIINAVCCTAMYAVGFYCGQVSSRSHAIVARPADPNRFINTWLDATCPDRVITLAEAIKDGQALSERLGCTIRLKYRDKVVRIYRGRSHQQLMEDYVNAPEEEAAR